MIEQISLLDDFYSFSLTGRKDPVEENKEPVLSTFEALCQGKFGHIRVRLSARMRDGWRAQWRKGECLLVVPSLLYASPANIKISLLRWAAIVAQRSWKRNADLRIEKRSLESVIQEHLQKGIFTSAGISALPPKVLKNALERNRRRLDRLQPQGRFHDLEPILTHINGVYFNGRLQVRITWSRRLGGLSTHTLQQDGQGQTYHLISISRGYDVAGVSAEIVGGVVYHECLHADIPSFLRNGRRVVHGPEFRKRERLYAHFREWMRWHREELPIKLAKLRRSHRSHLQSMNTLR